ncbi:MAG: hypothetical protein HOK45_00110 [Verrucomicrobia bacterium]|nr:hypothetical protein [Verrucomicrobiota bacterium]
MQTSLIQEPSGTAHSKTTRSSQHKNEDRTEDSFRDRFNAELYNKDGVVNKSPDKISKELEEAEWLSGASSGSAPPSPENNFKSGESANPEILNRASQESHSSRSASKVSTEDSDSQTSGSKEKAEVKDTKSNAESREQTQSGKNISNDEKPAQRGANITPRPALDGKNPLSHGSVKVSEKMLMTANSAASSTSQAISMHHGTAHASSNSRSKESVNTQKLSQQRNMSTNNTKQPVNAKGEAILNGPGKLIRPVMAGNGSEESMSFGGSFSDGKQDENSVFLDKDSGNNTPNTPIQSFAKTSIAGPSRSSTMVESIQRIQSMVEDQVVVMKSAPGQSMQVMIRPDANMALTLTLQQSESNILVAAKMDQSTANLLKPHWEEIQRELSQQGIRLGDPELGSHQESPAQQDGKRGQADDTNQHIFPSQSQKSALKDKTPKGTLHKPEPITDDIDGSLVSWA